MDDLFKALKSFPNRVFVDYITRLEDDWEIDAKDDTPTSIDLFITSVRTKYSNINSRSKQGVIDPSNAKILTLSTQLQEVQQKLLEERGRNDGASNSAHARKTDNSSQHPRKESFDTRRTKYTGSHTVIDGVAHDWCDKEHKSSASPNGMYMSEGHNHEEQLSKKLAHNKTRAVRSSTTFVPSSDTANSVKLALSEKMKACLMTKTGFSEEKFIALCDDVHLNQMA